MFTPRAWGALTALVIAGVLLSIAVVPSLAQTDGVTEYEVVTETIEPVTARNLSGGLRLTRQELEALRMQTRELRETVSEAEWLRIPDVEGADPSAEVEALAGPAGEVTEAAQGEAPGDTQIARNVRNTRASTVGSTLAEPAAANEGAHILYTGNTYASTSTNEGSSWASLPLPSGPSDAPFACCDLTVLHDQARAVTFYSALYFNATATNGVVRIFVRPSIASSGGSCSYTIDPGGTANNLLPDYPHIGISNNFLYLTTNSIVGGTTWAGSQVRRFNLNQMAACQTTAVSTFTYGPSVGTGQRVFVPVEGARGTMYWGQIETSTSFRVFRWPESAASPSSVVRTISRTNQTNPDCRGGTGNFDWIERSTAWSSAGFRIRGAVGPYDEAGNGYLTFYWNSAPNGSITQAHIRAARFRVSDLTLVAQPHLFNNSFCLGYPAVSVNERGDLGLTFAYGGRAGGGGSAAQGAVMFCELGNCATFFTTASGTHNRSDARFGDYFTIHPHEPCDLYFVATNYALSGGNTLSSHVNARYVAFGQERARACFNTWSTKAP